MGLSSEPIWGLPMLREEEDVADPAPLDALALWRKYAPPELASLLPIRDGLIAMPEVGKEQQAEEPVRVSTEEPFFLAPPVPQEQDTVYFAVPTASWQQDDSTSTVPLDELVRIKDQLLGLGYGPAYFDKEHYNPGQLRGPDGKWIDEGKGAAEKAAAEGKKAQKKSKKASKEAEELSKKAAAQAKKAAQHDWAAEAKAWLDQKHGNALSPMNPQYLIADLMKGVPGIPGPVATDTALDWQAQHEQQVSGAENSGMWQQWLKEHYNPDAANATAQAAAAALWKEAKSKGYALTGYQAMKEAAQYFENAPSGWKKALPGEAEKKPEPEKQGAAELLLDVLKNVVGQKEGTQDIPPEGNSTAKLTVSPAGKEPAVKGLLHGGDVNQLTADDYKNLNEYLTEYFISEPSPEGLMHAYVSAGASNWKGPNGEYLSLAQADDVAANWLMHMGNEHDALQEAQMQWYGKPVGASPSVVAGLQKGIIKAKKLLKLEKQNNQALGYKFSSTEDKLVNLLNILDNQYTNPTEQSASVLSEALQSLQDVEKQQAATPTPAASGSKPGTGPTDAEVAAANAKLDADIAANKQAYPTDWTGWEGTPEQKKQWDWLKETFGKMSPVPDGEKMGHALMLASDLIGVKNPGAAITYALAHAFHTQLTGRPKLGSAWTQPTQPEPQVTDIERKQYAYYFQAMSEWAQHLAAAHAVIMVTEEQAANFLKVGTLAKAYSEYLGKGQQVYSAQSASVDYANTLGVNMQAGLEHILGSFPESDVGNVYIKLPLPVEEEKFGGSADPTYQQARLLTLKQFSDHGINLGMAQPDAPVTPEGAGAYGQVAWDLADFLKQSAEAAKPASIGDTMASYAAKLHGIAQSLQTYNQGQYKVWGVVKPVLEANNAALQYMRKKIKGSTAFANMQHGLGTQATGKAFVEGMAALEGPQEQALKAHKAKHPPEVYVNGTPMSYYAGTVKDAKLYLKQDKFNVDSLKKQIAGTKDPEEVASLKKALLVTKAGLRQSQQKLRAAKLKLQFAKAPSPGLVMQDLYHKATQLTMQPATAANVRKLTDLVWQMDTLAQVRGVNAPPEPKFPEAVYEAGQQMQFPEFVDENGNVLDPGHYDPEGGTFVNYKSYEYNEEPMIEVFKPLVEHANDVGWHIKNAAADYMGMGYHDLNAYLRTGEEPEEFDEDDALDDYDPGPDQEQFIEYEAESLSTEWKGDHDYPQEDDYEDPDDYDKAVQDWDAENDEALQAYLQEKEDDYIEEKKEEYVQTAEQEWQDNKSSYSTTDDVYRMQSALDDLFALPEARAPENLQIWRKGYLSATDVETGEVEDHTADYQHWKPGKTVLQDLGFVSCSLDRNVSDNFSGGLFIVELPKGLPAAYLDAFSNGSEQEMLLPRGSKFVYLGMGKDVAGHHKTEYPRLRYLGPDWEVGDSLDPSGAGERVQQYEKAYGLEWSTLNPQAQEYDQELAAVLQKGKEAAAKGEVGGFDPDAWIANAKNKPPKAQFNRTEYRVGTVAGLRLGNKTQGGGSGESREEYLRKRSYSRRREHDRFTWQPGDLIETGEEVPDAPIRDGEVVPNEPAEPKKPQGGLVSASRMAQEPLSGPESHFSGGTGMFLPVEPERPSWGFSEALVTFENPYAQFKYNPTEARDWHGQWTSGAAGSGAPAGYVQGQEAVAQALANPADEVAAEIGMQPHGWRARDIMYKVAGAQAGTNPGHFWQGKDGVQRYVKPYADPTQAHGEHVANAIYRAVGVGAPVSDVFQDSAGDELYASEIVPGSDLASQVGHQGIDKRTANQILDGFVADVLLANWDVNGLEFDNIIRVDGDLYRIDNGSALLHRAQGARKPASALEDLGEWESMGAHGRNAQYREVWRQAGIDGPDDPAFAGRARKQTQALLDLYQRSGNWDNFLRAVDPAWAGQDRDEVEHLLEVRLRRLVAKTLGSKLAQFRYNPAETRDWHGRWTRGPAGGGGAARVAEAPRALPLPAEAFPDERRTAGKPQTYVPPRNEPPEAKAHREKMLHDFPPPPKPTSADWDRMTGAVVEARRKAAGELPYEARPIGGGVLTDAVRKTYGDLIEGDQPPKYSPAAMQALKAEGYAPYGDYPPSVVRQVMEEWSYHRRGERTPAEKHHDALTKEARQKREKAIRGNDFDFDAENRAMAQAWDQIEPEQRSAIAAGVPDWDAVQGLPNVNWKRARRVADYNAAPKQSQDAALRAQAHGYLSVEDYYRASLDHLRQMTSKASVASRVSQRGLHSILQDGRMKTQFETKDSAGMLDNETRRDAENLLFNTDRNITPTKRPVYGYLTDDPEEVNADTGAWNQLMYYGDVTLVFKPEVRKRTTFMFGDTIASAYADMTDYTPEQYDLFPAPLEQPNLNTYHHSYGDIMDIEHIQDTPNESYTEAQVHGGITLKDIAYVVLPEWVGHDETRSISALKQELDEAGIPWRIKKQEPIQPVFTNAGTVWLNLALFYDASQLRGPDGRWVDEGKGKHAGPRRQGAERKRTIVNLGVTPYRGKPVHEVQGTEGYYTSTRYRGWLQDVKAEAKRLGLQVRDVMKSAGIWQGSKEPSASVWVEGDYNAARELAGSIGGEYNQEGVLLFTGQDDGPSALYTFKDLPDPEAASAALQKAGIDAGRIQQERDGRYTLEVVDLDGSLYEGIKKVRDALGVDVSATPGKGELLWGETDYKRRSHPHKGRGLTWAGAEKGGR